MLIVMMAHFGKVRNRYIAIMESILLLSGIGYIG